MSIATCGYWLPYWDCPGLEQLCALEPSAMMGMYSSSVPDGSHWPHGTIEHWKCGKYGWGTEFGVSFPSNEFKFKFGSHVGLWLPYGAAQCEGLRSSCRRISCSWRFAFPSPVITCTTHYPLGSPGSTCNAYPLPHSSVTDLFQEPVKRFSAKCFWIQYTFYCECSLHGHMDQIQFLQLPHTGLVSRLPMGFISENVAQRIFWIHDSPGSCFLSLFA